MWKSLIPAGFYLLIGAPQDADVIAIVIISTIMIGAACIFYDMRRLP